MNLRAYLGSKIPRLITKTAITDADITAVTSTSAIHRWFVGADIAWGAIGSATPATTISARTARTCQLAQDILVTIRATPGMLVTSGDWYGLCPIWALALGAALESLWALPFISYPGHLQDALDADLARQVAGLHYLTGTRVFK